MGAYDVLRIPAACTGTWNLKGSLFAFGQICAFNFVQDIVKAWKSGVLSKVQSRGFKQLLLYIKKLKHSKWLRITKSTLQSVMILRLLQTASKESGCCRPARSGQYPASDALCVLYSSTHRHGIQVNVSVVLSMVSVSVLSSLTRPWYSTQYEDTYTQILLFDKGSLPLIYCSIKDPHCRSGRHLWVVTLWFGTRTTNLTRPLRVA